MRFIVAIILSALLLAGCSSSPRAVRGTQTDLVGLSRQDLLQCAGNPIQQERIGDIEFLAFAGSTGSKSGLAGDRRCEAAFVLKEGAVRVVNYREGGVLLPAREQCAFIIDGCSKH